MRIEIEGVPEQNPMLNTVVLERLFKLVDFDVKTFSNYRLVCKEWYETSLTIWRKNAWLPISTCHRNPGVYLEDFIPLLKSPENRLIDVPYRKYIISNWIGIIHDYREEKQEKQEFWKTVGPLMTHLNLKSSYFYITDNFRKVVFELTPNLQSLTLRDNHYMVSQPGFSARKVETFDPQQMGLQVQKHLIELKVNMTDWERFPLTCLELLWHFPNIEMFEPIYEEPSFVRGFVCKLFGNIEVLRNTVGSHYFKNLSELHLLKLDRDRNNRLTYTLELPLVLQRLQFPLKVLTFSVASGRNFEHAKEMLKIVLETHANTLEELILARPEESIQFPDFPFGIQFPKLARFRSTGKLVQNLEFLKFMSNLEFLFLEQEGKEIRLRKVDSSNSFANTNLKEFKITEKFCTEKELKFLGAGMPNLTKITLGLKNKQCFEEVCRIWKEVTDLNIYSKDSDEDAYWKSEEVDKYIRASIDDLIELRCLKMGKLVEYSE